VDGNFATKMSQVQNLKLHSEGIINFDRYVIVIFKVLRNTERIPVHNSLLYYWSIFLKHIHHVG
jgi:hypothetical protein